MTVLDVYLEAVAKPIGKLMSRPDGEMSFTYVTDDLPHSISLSLPVRDKPFGDVVTRGFEAEIGHDGADLMIAASALRHAATVVTKNTSDFAPTGVALEDPF